MTDLATIVKVGNLVKDIQSDMRWSEKHKQDAYKTLDELNGVLRRNDEKEMKMEDILQLTEEE